MKQFTAIAAALMLALPLTVAAQSGTTPPAAKAQAKPAAKSGSTAKAKQTPKKQVTRRAAKAVEEVTPVQSPDAQVSLTEADLEVAKKVHTGRIQCELGADVTVTADAAKPGFFTVATKGARYRMHPVESRTGAIRLEDSAAGAMWLQLGNKSMLMNQKKGQRLADECQGEAQLAVASEMKKNPPKSLLDDTPSR